MFRFTLNKLLMHSDKISVSSGVILSDRLDLFLNKRYFGRQVEARCFDSVVFVSLSLANDVIKKGRHQVVLVGPLLLCVHRD